MGEEAAKPGVSEMEVTGFSGVVSRLSPGRFLRGQPLTWRFSSGPMSDPQLYRLRKLIYVQPETGPCPRSKSILIR